MGFIVPVVRLQSRLGSLFGAAKAALPDLFCYSRIGCREAGWVAIQSHLCSAISTCWKI